MPKLGSFGRILGVAAGLAALAVAGAGAAPAKKTGITLVGAGSSLIAPAVAIWQPLYSQARGVEIQYSAIGSGGGIGAITSKTVDFGASDAPLSPDQQSACSDCKQIPWALSATVPSYNIPGVGDTKLRLTGSVLANIFLGQITKWDDPALKKINPGVNLPSMNITVVHRSDGSGDTYAFTDYLSHVSGTWKSKVGTSTSVSWPTGVGGAKNAGVAAIIGSTQGSIGYLSDAYVLQNHLSKARVKNASGHFALPSINSIEEAAQTVKKVPASNALSIVNPPKGKKYADAWPLSTFTYVIVRASSPKAHDLKNFISWVLAHGQAPIRKDVFAPIPLVVLRAANKTLAQIHS
jgi:phosphate transport system substrate-binding protein